MHLFKNTKHVRVSNAVAAGTTEVDCTSIDLEATGAEGVKFTAHFGALTATQVTSMKAQGSNDNSAWDDLANTKVGPLADGDSNKCLELDVYRPQGYRYVRAVISRGTANAVVDSVSALLYGPRVAPTSLDSTVSAGKVVASPAKGTP